MKSSFGFLDVCWMFTKPSEQFKLFVFGILGIWGLVDLDLCDVFLGFECDDI